MTAYDVIGEKFKEYTDDHNANRRWVSVKGKVPVVPGTDTPVEWRKLENRYTWQEIQKIPGDFGIILNKTGLSCLDFDKCLNEQGEIITGKQYVQGILEQLNTFTEISSSDTGLHAWIVTDANTKNEKPGTYELITDGHVKVTGNPYPPYTDKPIQMVEGERLREILKRIASKKQPGTGTKTGTITTGTRNDTLFRTAAALRGKGLSQAAILVALKAENLERCNPPFPDKEITTIAASAGKYPAGKPGEKSKPDEINIEIKNKALEILQTGDPVSHMLMVYNKDHVGDVLLGKSYIAAIGCTLCSNTDGIHPGTTGKSGAGKSHSMKTVLHQIPEEWVFSGSFSDQAWFYSGMKEGTILFLDDAENLKDLHRDIIKQVSTTYQEGYERKSVDSKERKIIQVKIPPRPCFFINSAGGDYELQFLNRQINLAVNETHLDEIFEKQTKDGISGDRQLTRDEDWQVVREIWRILKNAPPINVKIPFLNEIEWNNRENTRNWPMFHDTISAFTAIRQHRRAGIEGHIIADRQDADDAIEIWNSISHEQKTKLNTKQLGVMHKIIEMMKKGGKGELLRADLARELPGMTSGDLTHILKGRRNRVTGGYEGGLINLVPGLDITRVASKDYNNDIKQGDLIVYNGVFNIWGEFSTIVRWKPAGDGRP